MFDDASTGKARAAFAQLDNMISRDAMQRLRSSPQGSVLGALNALFSPHPVTGAPSAQQAASQGLLGKMFGPQGGGNTAMPAGSSSGGSTVIRDVVTGKNPAPQQKTTVTVTGGGGGVSPQAVRDLEDAATGMKNAADDLSAAAGQAQDAAQASGDTARVTRDAAGRSASAADKAGDAADRQDAAARDLSGAASGVRGVFDSLRRMLGSGGGGGGGGGLLGAAKAVDKLAGGTGNAKGNLASNLAGGLGPGILGLSLKTGTIAGLGGSLLGALPALGAIGATLGVGGIGGSVLEMGAKQLIGQKNTKANPNAEGPLYQQAQQVTKTAQAVFQNAAGGMLAPLKQAFGEIPGLLRGIEPALKAVFAGAGTLIQPLLMGLDDIAKDVLPGLGKAFRAVAPLIQPLLHGFSQLAGGLLTGLVTLLKAAAPAVKALASGLGDLGAGLGKMLGDFAPVIRASSTIFEALLDVISGLFPVIGKLAQVFASALAPVFVQLAGIVKSLLPVFQLIGQIAAQLAQALIGDLVGAVGTLAQILTGIEPGLNAFAKAIGGVFTVLENTGIFAILGDALESLAGPITTLINALLKGLAPILPLVIKFVAQLSAQLSASLAQAIAAILPPLTQLATVALQSLSIVLPVILPILAKVLGLFTNAVADAITGVANALAAIINAIPPGVLQGIVIAIGGIVAATKLWAAAQALLNVAMDANPVGLFVLAVAAIGTAFYEAWEKSAGFRQGIKDVGAAFLQIGIVIVEGARNITNAFLSMVGTVLHAAADAFGWVPGLGSKLRDASKSFDDFKAHVNNGFNDTIHAMQRWQGELLNATDKSRTLAQAATDAATAFTRQKTAADAANTSLDTYTEQVKKNGVGSSQAQHARQQLITDLQNAGLSSYKAGLDVSAYTDAILKNGVNSSQAQHARQQLITDILGASKNAQQGYSDMENYSAAVRKNGADSSQAQSARQRLITDLENAGLNAKTATRLVDSLGSAIGKLKGKNVTINMTGDGTYTIKQLTGQGLGVQGPPPGVAAKAAGGYIAQGTTGTADDVPIMASRGEYVVKASSVAKYGTPMMDAINAGNFAGGGMVGGNLTPAYISGMYGDFEKQMTASMVAAMRASLNAAKSAAQQAGGGYAGPGGGAPAANAALAKKLYPAWASGAEWAAWNNVAMRESGWNQYAQNASSGAYGIPQALPYTKMPRAAWPASAGGSSNPTAQITWMIGYIKGRYGDPQNAWAHELSAGSYAKGGPVRGGIYDQGGMLWPGLTMALNTSGQPEHVISGQGMDSLQMLLQILVSHMAMAVGWLRHIAGGGTPGSAPGYPGVTGLAGQVNAAAGYPGITGAFGLDRSALGLPATTTTSSSSTGTSGTSSTPAAPAKHPAKHPAKAGPNLAQRAAINVLEHMMGGLIWHNKLGEARQANALLNWLGVTKYNSRLSEIGFLDAQLLNARKKKDKAAESAAEKLLATYGVHSWNPGTAAKGNAPKSAVIAGLEKLIRTDIKYNSLTVAGQANALLTHLGVSKYTSALSAIGRLDKMLAKYRKAKDAKDVKATEELLRQYGVMKFAQGGTVWEPVTGVGHRSGRVYQFAEHGPEHITPGQGASGDKTAALLGKICTQLDQLTGVAAAIPRGTGEHVGAALGAASQSASFRSRYPVGGW